MYQILNYFGGPKEIITHSKRKKTIIKQIYERNG